MPYCLTAVACASAPLRSSKMLESGAQSSWRPNASMAVSRARHHGELRTTVTRELVGSKPLSHALGMRDTAGVEIALALTALEAPARGVAHASSGLGVAHQQHRPAAQLAQQRHIVGGGAGMHTTDDAQGDQATADQSDANRQLGRKQDRSSIVRTLHITVRSIRTGMQCIDNDADHME